MPRLAFRFAATVAACAVIGFFALTQTQVGREQLRQQLEAGFARQFHGTLHIGHLSGNLVGTLQADRVALLDLSGDTVLAARSVVARPKWALGFFVNRIELRELWLENVRVHAVRDSSRRWNVQQVLTPRRSRPVVQANAPPKYRLGQPHLVIRNAQVWVEDHTIRPKAVQDGRVFDALNARYSALNADLSIDRRDEGLDVRLAHLSGWLPDYDVGVQRASGRARLGDSTWTVYDAELRAGRTQLDADAMRLADQSVRLDVRGTVDFEALRRLAPALPLASTARLDLAGTVRRDPLDQTIEATLALLRLRASGVELATSGAFVQTPDSLRLALDALDASATASGLNALAPGLPARTRALAQPSLALDLGPTQVALARAGGALRFATEGRVRQGDASAQLQRLAVVRAPGGTVEWDARVAADRFDLARFLPGRAATVLSGQIDTQGDATPLPAAGLPAGAWTVRTARARVRLGPSVVEGRRLDSLRLNVASTGRTVVAQGRVVPTGAGSATFDLEGVPSFDGRTAHSARGTLGFREFNVGPLLARADVRTRITGTARLDGQGRTLADLAGQTALALDQALVQAGAQAVTVRRTDATLQRRADGTLALTLDLADGKGTVNGTPVTLRGTTASITRSPSGVLDLAVRLDDGQTTVQGQPVALGETVATVRRAPDGAFSVAATTALGAVDLSGTGDLDAMRALAEGYRPRLVAYLQSRLPAYSGDTTARLLPPLRLPARPVTASGTVRVFGGTLLRRAAPDLAGDGLRATFALAAEPSGLRLEASFDADTLAHVRGRAARLHADATLRDDGIPQLTLDAQAARFAAGAFRADDARLAATATGPALTLRFEGLRRFDLGAAPRTAGNAEQRASDALAEGDIDLDALEAGALAHTTPSAAPATPADTFRIAFAAERLDDRLRVALDTFAFGAGPLRLAARPTAFDAYRDAVVFPSPVELSGVTAGGGRQVLRISGTASARPEHRLQLDAEQVSLATLVAATPLRQRLLGSVNARLVVASALARPGLIGDVTVDNLALQAVVGGEARGTPQLLGDLALQADYRQGDSTGHVDLRLRPTDGSSSEATGSGTFRLPQGTQPGSVDVTADLTHLEGALLDALVPALFSRSEGHAHGLLTVQGDLRKPDYLADLVVDSVRSTIPLLGTAARATGFVRLTPDGIALRSVRAVDPTGGSVVINGSLDGPVGRPPTVNLSLAMDAFRLIDLPAATDFPIYGQVWLTGTGSIKGRPDALRVTARGVEASPRSNVFIPLRAETTTSVAPGYLTFLDTLGLGRTNLPRGLNPAAGLVLDLDVRAPSGTGFNLAFDPLVGDVMRAKGAGRLQLRLDEGVFQMFGNVNIEGGDYLFTAGDVFVRRFALDGGTLTFDGPPTDARLAIRATYRTRASLAGLPLATDNAQPVPLVVRMDVTERLSAPRVALTLALDRSRDTRASAAVEGFEALLNQPERQAEYATSVLLTNSFLLTSQAAEQAGLAQSGNRLAFASLSQLVATQLNRYLADVLPGIELTLGFQDTRTSALDVTYGVALRLLDDRLTLRGEGVLSTDTQQAARDVLRGEFVVEVRLGPTVSAEVFYRRDNDLYESVASGTLTNTTGASLSYRTRFTTWQQFFDRLF